MRNLKTYLLVGFFVVSIVGTLWHFVYEWSGNNVILGFFAPTNESVFEHMKLVFFPSVAYLFVARHFLKERYANITTAMSLGICIGTWFLPAFFYSYSGILGRNLMVIDIASFFLATFLVFFSTYRHIKKADNPVWIYLLFFLSALFFIFTYKNPGVGIFLVP